MIQSVIVTDEAYQQMFKYVIEFANPERPYRQWREVIGWLVGTVDEIPLFRKLPRKQKVSMQLLLVGFIVILHLVSSYLV